MAQTVTNAVTLSKAGKTAGFRVIRIALILVILSILTLVIAPPVLADPALPDSTPTFPRIYVNRSLIESGDFLLVAEYDLPYAVLPTDAANVNYIFELVDTDATTKLGAAEAYPYGAFDYGYNLGVVSFYFDAADAPTWGSNYILRVTTNPAKYSTLTSYDTTVPSIAYSTLGATATAAQQLELTTRLQTIIGDLTSEYGVELISSQDAGMQLTSYGESYFREAIPGLQSMAPLLFFVQNISYDTSTRTWGTSLGDTYKARLAGVDGIVGTADDNWIMASLVGVGDWLNIPFLLLIGGILVVVCVLLIKFSVQRFGTPVAGYVGSLLVVMCGGVLMMGFTVIAIIAFALILFGGWFIFMRHA